MRWRPSFVPNVAAFLCVVASGARAAPPEGASPAVPVADSAAVPPKESAVERIATGKGFLFHPSTTPLGKFRFGLGALYDAVDPAVMYGMSFRVPQLTADARFGLGKGWALKGHLNSMLVVNELLIGGAYAHRSGAWSIEGSASLGIYYGKLGEFGFDATLISPQYRPELTVGYRLNDGVALSLKGSVLLMGPERASVGEVSGGLDNSNLFVGHSEMLYVENTNKSGSVWYFGLGAMTTRAYYQLWVLFPDSPGLYTYARATAGYEF
jgi:hypothetical protein